MPGTRPSVFIGSSSEGREVAEAIQANMDHDWEAVVWSQGLFGLSDGTLETLVEKSESFDFAILVLTPDDMIESRGTVTQAPRDNVLLEIGLFVGVLGPRRTFVVYDRGAGLKLPSDLAGVTKASYQRHKSDNLRATVGACCTEINTAVKALGLRPRRPANFDIDQNSHFQVICDLLDHPARQFLILMHEQSVTLRMGTMYGVGVDYAYMVTTPPRSAAGNGFFDVRKLCQSLADAKILEPDLRENVRLTPRGHEFATWLVTHGHKCLVFISGAGGWGDESLVATFLAQLRPAPQT
jgi:Predicted nucleotide-binding protein containing TIR-like domain